MAVWVLLALAAAPALAVAAEGQPSEASAGSEVAEQSEASAGAKADGDAQAEAAEQADGGAQAEAVAGDGAEAATGAEGNAEAEAESAPSRDVFQMVSDAVMPIVNIDEGALFARQFEWEAVENLNFDSANEDGSLSEWQTDWFISHDWSDYGHVIATLWPGDAVTVNGQTILILGRQEWSNEAYNWDVYDVVGWDKTVFQTCYGDYAIWIAYGIPVDPTPEFWASHPPSW